MQNEQLLHGFPGFFLDSTNSMERIRGEFIIVHPLCFFHVRSFGFSFHPSKLEGFTSSAIFGTIVGMLLGRNWPQIASNIGKRKPPTMACQVSHVPRYVDIWGRKLGCIVYLIIEARWCQQGASVCTYSLDMI